MPDEKWIKAQLKMAEEALERDTNREGPFSWDYGKHRRSAEKCITDLLDEEPFNKRGLEVYQKICLREINDAIDIDGTPLWPSYYDKLIRLSLIMIEKYPDTYDDQERLLLTYPFSIYDPYRYFRRAKIEQRLSYNNLQIFYNLLEAWYDKFTSNIRGFVLSEGLKISEKITDKEIAPYKYAVFKEAANRVFIYDGERIPLKDSLGLKYITVLLEHPKFRFSIYLLKEAVEGRSPNISSEHNGKKLEHELKEQGLYISKPQNSGPEMDDKGIADIKEWVVESRKKINMGDYQDDAKREVLEDKIEKAEKYLANTLDHRGKSKQLGDDESKAIGNAQTAIKRARGDVESVSLPLFTHFKAIRLMEKEFAYYPDREIGWLVLDK